MYHRYYNNFVRPSSTSEESNNFIGPKQLCGEEAKRLYLEEIAKEKLLPSTLRITTNTLTNCERKLPITVVQSDQDLFLAVQNDDVHTVRSVLEHYPQKVNKRDQFGWSLLMIACQASSVDTVKLLINLNADTSIRDKAGNSAQSLVIKNNNITLIDLFLSNKKHTEEEKRKKAKRPISKEVFICETCDNKIFHDKVEHLSSTIHNINASKGKKVGNCYKIPENNRGFQIMLKEGWDKYCGLGPYGSGQKYPIRTVQKIDRKGLGHEKTKPQKTEVIATNYKTMKAMVRDSHKNRKMEIEFRREFY